MTRDTDPTPTAAARAVPQEDFRKVLIAFFLALTMYLAVSVGALAVGKYTLDAEIAEAGPPPVQMTMDT